MLKEGECCELRDRDILDRETGDRKGHLDYRQRPVAARGQDKLRGLSPNVRQRQILMQVTLETWAQKTPSCGRVAGLLCRGPLQGLSASTSHSKPAQSHVDTVNGRGRTCLLDSSASVQDSTEMIHVCASILPNTEILVVSR